MYHSSRLGVGKTFPHAQHGWARLPNTVCAQACYVVSELLLRVPAAFPDPHSRLRGLPGCCHRACRHGEPAVADVHEGCASGAPMVDMMVVEEMVAPRDEENGRGLGSLNRQKPRGGDGVRANRSFDMSTLSSGWDMKMAMVVWILGCKTSRYSFASSVFLDMDSRFDVGEPAFLSVRIPA